MRSALALVLGSLLAVATILILAVGIAVGMGVGSGLLDYLIRGLPAVDQAIDARVFRTATVYDRQGRLLDEVWDPEGGKRTIVPLSEIPSYLVDATLATEDPRFYENPGFDAAAIVRALWQNVSGQSILSGASTITQQLVRNSLFTPAERYDRSYVRKAKEVVLAYELSRRYTKDEILGRYLNEINYGNLAYGVEAAAQTYFGKSAGQLTIAEAALLAGLPQAPYAHDPLVHPEDARARQLEVLGLMVRHGYLAASAAEVAAREELHFQKPRTEIRAPHFAFYVRSLLEERYSRDQIYYSGLRVYTTLDLDLQDAAERAAQRHLATLRDQGAGNAAVVAIDPRTGEILAMLGSADYWDDAISGQINMALAPRPPASALKPFTYLTAFARNRASPGSVLLDEPTSFSGGAGAPAYRPENADGKFRGPVTARRALANSLNVPTVRLLAQVGVPALLDTVHELGVTTLNSPPEHYGLSLALGSGEVRLLDLTYAYAALANGGLQVGEPVPGAERLPGRREFRPVAISRVEDDSGKVLEEYRPSGKSVVSPQAAWLVTDILADAAARAETAGDGLVRLPFPAATQVGASEGFENSWAFGYTPGLAVGVWVGNASNQPMRGVTGLTGAAPIWRSVVEAALRGQPYLPFSRPTGLVQVAIDPRTGLRPGPGVPAIGDWFVEGNVPKAWAIPTPTATPLPTPTPRPTPTPMPRPTPTPAPTPTSGQVPSGMILVPSFVGMPEADARRLAGSLGLGSADTNYQTAGDVADKAFFASIRPGSVLSQIPAPGSIVAKGTTLYIAVRKE